jgi:hypothetical protein
VSNVLLGIIGVIMFIGLAIAGATYYGPALMGSKIEAQASDYLSQSSQIARAIESYSSDNGKLPMDSGGQPVAVLVSAGYMKGAPPGGRSPWVWSAGSKAILTPAGVDNVEGLKICTAARRRAGIANPGTLKACSDTTISKGDPCCLM